jgi:hypothetical protein
MGCSTDSIDIEGFTRNKEHNKDVFYVTKEIHTKGGGGGTWYCTGKLVGMRSPPTSTSFLRGGPTADRRP